jgi:hypothetical protein
MMSESLITKETSLPDFRLENNDFENPGWSVRNERHTVTKLILVDPVEDEDSSTD